MSTKTKVPKPILKMSEGEYHDLCRQDCGVCLACLAIAWGGCEPDAGRYPCEDCGANRVYGIEQALMFNRIEITDKDQGVF